MHPQAIAFLALELANERVREADQERLARRATRREPSIVRRIAARAAAAGGIALARAAVRLDPERTAVA